MVLNELAGSQTVKIAIIDGKTHQVGLINTTDGQGNHNMAGKCARHTIRLNMFLNL